MGASNNIHTRVWLPQEQLEAPAAASAVATGAVRSYLLLHMNYYASAMKCVRYVVYAGTKTTATTATDSAATNGTGVSLKQCTLIRSRLHCISTTVTRVVHLPVLFLALFR